jgi:hypothetical protein
MEVLKTPLIIDKTIVDALAKQKRVLGLYKRLAMFVVIQDYKVEEKKTTTKRWGFLSRKTITGTTYYLTEFRFHIWNVKRQCWTHLSAEGLEEILYDEDFTKMRGNYLAMIKAPLEFLGVKFKDKALNE